MSRPTFKIYIDQERCKGCELCAHVCPVSTLVISPAMNEKGNHYPAVSTEKPCAGCLQCAHICPDGAIEIEKFSTQDDGASQACADDGK